MAMNVCRVCIHDLKETDPNVKNIFVDNHNGKKLNEILESVVQDQINEGDPGPPLMCGECNAKLTTCFDFLTAYSQSKIVFQLLSKSKVFKETTKEETQSTTTETKKLMAIEMYKNKCANAQRRLQKKIKMADDTPMYSILKGPETPRKEPVLLTASGKPQPDLLQESKSVLTLGHTDNTIVNLDLNSTNMILYCNFCNFSAHNGQIVLDHIKSSHLNQNW